MPSALSERLETARSLSELSTFRIGGPARLFVEVRTLEEMKEALLYCRQNHLAFFILGKGSNCLFHDRGFDGLVIANHITFCERRFPDVHVGAGYSFSLLGSQTAKEGWGGLEFASGIPGTVGGAIYMNAGANGADTSQTLKEVTFLTDEGTLLALKREELQFGYRFSSFQQKRGAIISALFTLFPSEGAKEKQQALIAHRQRTQPYRDPSAGCVFRNPAGHFAGALIESSGLKGARVGGAEVSSLHANFIVNRGGASAEDVLKLAALIQRQVKEKSGVELELELRSIPCQEGGK